MTRLMGATVLCSSVIAAVAQAQPVRDNRTLTGVGTGTITGRVTTDDRDSRPLRRARVSLTSGDLDVGRATVTNDDGTFTFTRLPAGRYNVTAAKDGYVTMSLGADRPGRPGIGVEVRAGDNPPVTVRVPKGAVITGMVRLPTGEPAPGIVVVPLTERFNAATGERHLMAVANASVAADDRGEYRIYGLAAGTYVVSAAPRGGATPPGTEVQVLSDAEIRRAMSEVKAQSVAARPGMIAPAPSAARAAETPRTGVALTPIYFPGTASEKQAARLTLAAGQVRSGIDLDLSFVRVSTIEGYVSAPPGARVLLFIGNADGTSPNQTLRVTATPGEDGRFMFRSLPPGHYAISARAVPATPRPGSAGDTIAYGRTEVIVGGDDIGGITIPLRPALTISGRIVFKGTVNAPSLPAIRLPVTATTLGGSNSVMLPNVLVEGDRFTIAGAIPGIYRFPSPPMGVRTPIGAWWLESLIVNRKELLDGELDLQESDENAVITFSDRPTELTGAARYASGLPFREGLIVVFSADQRMWFLNSRRVAAVSTTNNGQYVVRNLPPGDYFITVAVGLERNEWFDREVLASLVESAQKITIRAGEARTHDLTLTR